MPKLFEALLDLVYPRFCFSCQDRIKEAGPVYLCPDCTSRVALIGGDICPVCGRPGYAELCRSCLEDVPPFKTARSAGLYEGILKDGVHRLKYGGERHLVPTLAEFLVRVFKKEWQDSIDLVVAVPMDRHRERERGFNQSALLAEHFARRLSLVYACRILAKAKKTSPQVNLAREKRLRNLRGAFGLNPRISIRDKRLLLIDDVYTTGATVAECANILLKGGAKEVNILTLARGI